MLAERWGHITPSGVALPLSLTHEALGRLIGARRPTVSLAVKALATAGRVTRDAEGSWHLPAESTLRTGVEFEALRAGGRPRFVAGAS